MTQFVHGDGRRKKSKTGEDGSYQTAQVGHGDGRTKKSKTGERRAKNNSFEFKLRLKF